jgi:hypothetical protein
VDLRHGVFDSWPEVALTGDDATGAVNMAGVCSIPSRRFFWDCDASHLIPQANIITVTTLRGRMQRVAIAFQDFTSHRAISPSLSQQEGSQNPVKMRAWSSQPPPRPMLQHESHPPAKPRMRKMITAIAKSLFQ